MLSETFHFIFRHKFLLLKAMLPLALILLVGFSLLLTGYNLRKATYDYDTGYALEIFLKTEAGQAARDSLERFLNAQPALARVEKVSAERALGRVAEVLGDDPTLVLGYNPLPASLVVFPRDQYKSKEYLESLRREVEQFSAVDQGVWAREWLDELDRYSGMFVKAAAVVLALVVFAYLFLFHLSINYLWQQYRGTAAKLYLLGMPGGQVHFPIYVWSVCLGIAAAGVSLLLAWLGVSFADRNFLKLYFFPAEHTAALFALVALLSFLPVIAVRLKIPRLGKELAVSFLFVAVLGSNAFSQDLLISKTTTTERTIPQAVEDSSAVLEPGVKQLRILDEQIELTAQLVGKLELSRDSLAVRKGSVWAAVDSSQSRIDRLKDALADNLRRFYVGYRPAPVLLMGAGDVQRAARQLHYFRATVTDMRAQIVTIEQLRRDLDLRHRELASLEAQTEKLLKKKNFEESLLEKRRQEKSRLLAQSPELPPQKNQIAAMESPAQPLTVAPAAPQFGFESLRGILPWPVEGRVARHFGPAYDSASRTETILPGIEISTGEPMAVKACADGVVFYSELLHGYGQIVIVDHGDGWYSLYGYLSQISKFRGENIAAGETVGLSGVNPMTSRPALFFGIRHREVSQDPIEWLR